MLDGQLIGRMIRASRVRLRMRQVDVAGAAGVSSDAVSDVENGRLDRIRVEQLQRIASSLGLRLRIQLLPTRGDLGHIVGDEAHAALVESTVRILRGAGWHVELEAESGAGSIDILAFNEATRTLLVVEVKTRLVDLQETLRALARVTRNAGIAARRVGWRPLTTSVLLVVGDTSTQRRVVDRHRAIFATAFPVRTRAARRWIAAPDHEIRALMFLPYAPHRRVVHHVAIRVRPQRSPGTKVDARSGCRAPAGGSIRPSVSG